MSFYADDAVVLPPNQAAVTTKDRIRNLWKGFLDSLTDISWKTTRVEMAKSGDMGYLIGTYEMTMKDGSKDKGKYCEVWKKKADGKWKVSTDMFSRICQRRARLRLRPQALHKGNRTIHISSRTLRQRRNEDRREGKGVLESG